MFEFLIIGIVAYGLWKLFSDNGNTDKASEQQKRENNSTIVKPKGDTVNTIKPQGNSVDTINPIKPRSNSDITESVEPKGHETIVKTKEYIPVGKTGYDGLADNKISKRNNTIAEQISYLEKRYAGKVFEAKSIQKIEKMKYIAQFVEIYYFNMMLFFQLEGIEYIIMRAVVMLV